ncbi:signal peptidase I [Anaeroplasma bactoclasticum]|uniref:Signal peptidase I n=2 Tax=Anaeroplasma bactoclasticum TaxID=2088 RepID=A0A397RND5_9MOLU|nr:signal peptidase I [Anaeroplasma bactoclasticum]
MNRMEDIYPFILEAFSKDLTFTFPIHGTSMLPMLKTGDLVTIKKVESLQKGDIVLFRRFDESFVLHRIIRVNNDSYDIVGDHQGIVEKNVLFGQMIGVVISYNKNGKEHHMKNLRYKIYKALVRITLLRKIFGRIFKWGIRNIPLYYLLSQL